MRWPPLAGALVLSGIVVAVWAAPGARIFWREKAIRGAPSQPDVLLITLDTTRADRLGCYGGDPGTTPFLDGLAEAGVRFRRAYTHVPTTLASHASLFTGLIPARHGVHENGAFTLDAAPPTLAEGFARAGYRTGAFVSASVLDRRYGLARGFEHYGDELGSHAAGGALAEIGAETTVDRALGFLTGRDARPVFAWVHLYDPHHPYEPPEPFATQFRGRPYDGEIAYMDAQIGRLLSALSPSGRPTLVAAVADHGESLGEHLEPTHAFFVYGATQHVPLLLSYPGVLPAGRSVEPLVRTVDLMPTLLELARLPVPDAIDGRTLLPLVTGRSDREPGPAYQEAYGPRLFWGAQEVLGVRTGSWLFVRAPRPELYDVVEDPGETVNLAAEKPEELERLQAVLQQLLPHGDPLARRASVDPEAARQLRALGYVGGAGASDAAAGTDALADPKDVAPLLREIADAEDLLARRDLEAARAAFERLSALLPRAVSLRTRTAEILLDTKRYDQAFAAYRALSEENPHDEGHFVGMARARLQQGQARQALDLARAGVARFPGSATLRLNAGTLLAALGRPAEAEADYREAARLDPRLPAPRLALALICDRDGRTDEAAGWFLDVVELSPDSRLGSQAGKRLGTLAEGFARAGRLERARDAYLGALRTAEAEAPIYLNAALVSFRLGRRQEAVQTLTRAAASFPDSADVHYRLGRVQAELKAYDDAESAYVRALELDVNRQDVRLALAKLLEASGRLPQAAVIYQQLAEAKPPVKESSSAAAALRRLQSGGGR